MIRFSGLNGETGRPWTPERSPQELFDLLAGQPLPTPSKQMAFGFDAADPRQVGWGVLWPSAPSEVMRQALAPLIAWRKEQLGTVREFHVDSAMECDDFLDRWGVAPGTVEPDLMPFYLLIAATPQEISFAFQSELGASHAVGRLGSSDAEEVANYVERLVAYERQAVSSNGSATFFGVHNKGDDLTELSADLLTRPLASKVAKGGQARRVSAYVGQSADKRTLLQVLTSERPDVLFTASHGMCFFSTDPRQATRQGALVCADWSESDGRILDTHCFAASDLTQVDDLSGLVVCNFGCYSAGTPVDDSYNLREPETQAKHSFVAPLATALLRRGALGVVGHVDITFEESFLKLHRQAHVAHFENLIHGVLAGQPLGLAMRHMADRYCQLATRLYPLLKKGLATGNKKDLMNHLSTWAGVEDARNFVLLGDPAARLNT